MASSQERILEIESDPESDQSDCSDDSSDDPSFDVLEETRSVLSTLSLKKPKTKGLGDLNRTCKDVDVVNVEVEPDIPKLDEKDEKSFEKVEELIKGGDLVKLKIDQCKLYLRKYGLRLTGTKGVLVSRIQEHIDIIDGRGEKKYPPESFILNCKGDACLGDVVMFEQNVYEMFSIASRSATGPSCGTRTVAGRIVKESYGAAKQQHTFTIEVLWSKGVKPWPPLHPLLIKGRNLYRIKTMRQMWDNEPERRKVLQEKHNRGFCARSSRDMRIQMKERRNNGQVIKRKNISADKENQHLQRGNNHRRGGYAALQHLLPSIGSQILCRNNITGVKENNHLQIQKIGKRPILQQPLPSILGKPPPELPILFPQAPTAPSLQQPLPNILGKLPPELATLQAPRASLHDHRTHVGTSQAQNSWNSGIMNHRDRQHYHHGRHSTGFNNSLRSQHHYNGTSYSHHMHQTLQNQFMHRQQQ